MTNSRSVKRLANVCDTRSGIRYGQALNSCQIGDPPGREASCGWPHQIGPEVCYAAAQRMIESGIPPKASLPAVRGATARIKVLGDPIPHQDMALIKTSSSKRYKNEWTRLVRGYRPSSLQLVKGVDRVSGLSGQRAETPPYEQQHFAD
jgi:hypothetical protein